MSNDTQSPENDAAKCCAQTYWYDHGMQRADWCDKPATVRTRALDGSVNDFCAQHGERTIRAGATRVTPPATPEATR